MVDISSYLTKVWVSISDLTCNKLKILRRIYHSFKTHKTQKLVSIEVISDFKKKSLSSEHVTLN
jgi:hypothetical protein